MWESGYLALVSLICQECARSVLWGLGPGRRTLRLFSPTRCAAADPKAYLPGVGWALSSSLKPPLPLPVQLPKPSGPQPTHSKGGVNTVLFDLILWHIIHVYEIALETNLSRSYNYHEISTKLSFKNCLNFMHFMYFLWKLRRVVMSSGVWWSLADLCKGQFHSLKNKSGQFISFSLVWL